MTITSRNPNRNLRRFIALVPIVFTIGFAIFVWRHVDTRDELAPNVFLTDAGNSRCSSISLQDWSAQLAREEAEAWDAKRFAIRSGQEKQIYWSLAGHKTPLSLVYLHGFSAGPLELEPTMRLAAETLHANMYSARFKAHSIGGDGEAFAEAKAEEWVRDALEAIEIGSCIGDRVVVVGLSTGASLGLIADAILREAKVDEQRRPAKMILLSPNFRTQASGSALLMQPWFAPFASALVYFVVGSHYSFQTTSDLHKERWTPRYRSEGLVELMRVLRLLRVTPMPSVPTLTIYTAKDTVVDVGEIESRAREVNGIAGSKLINWEVAEQHQLASAAFQPEHAPELSAMMVDWILAGDRH